MVKEKKWRFGYVKHVVKQTQLAALSEEKALSIARDGLDYLHGSMQFCRGTPVALKDAMEKFKENSFSSREVKGSGKGEKIFEAEGCHGLKARGEVPYKGKVLRGEALNLQLHSWLQRGVIVARHGS